MLNVDDVGIPEKAVIALSNLVDGEYIFPAFNKDVLRLYQYDTKTGEFFISRELEENVEVKYIHFMWSCLGNNLLPIFTVDNNFLKFVKIVNLELNTTLSNLELTMLVNKLGFTGVRNVL